MKHLPCDRAHEQQWHICQGFVWFESVHKYSSCQLSVTANVYKTAVPEGSRPLKTTFTSPNPTKHALQFDEGRPETHLHSHGPFRAGKNTPGEQSRSTTTSTGSNLLTRALQQQNQQLLLLYRYSCATVPAAYTTSTESQITQNTTGLQNT